MNATSNISAVGTAPLTTTKISAAHRHPFKCLYGPLQWTKKPATPSIALLFLGSLIVFSLYIYHCHGTEPTLPDSLLVVEASIESASGNALFPLDDFHVVIEESQWAENGDPIDEFEQVRVIHKGSNLRQRLPDVGVSQGSEGNGMGEFRERSSDEGGGYSSQDHRETKNIFGYEKMAEKGFTCYRTVKGTYQTMERIVNLHPNLAELVDIGDSYEKTAAADGESDAGSDLWVLKLTNKSRQGGHRNKGIMFAIFGLHAREYAPVEIGTHFAEMLVSEYGKVADITQVLDHNEVHLLLQANPDGRRVAETDRKAWWRKNRNPTDGCKGKYGVDLNRNFGFMWGNTPGSSSNPCKSTYRGSRPFSEPEAAAIARYSRKIFPWALRRSDPEAKVDIPYDEDAASGMFVDMHSYGRLVVWPWGFKNRKIPNYDAYRALGHKLRSFNGYKPSGSGMANFMYKTSGDTLDYMWGSLGIPSMLFEVGGRRFDHPCVTLKRTIIPANLPALLFAAKISRAPFRIAKGPDIVAMGISVRNVPLDGNVLVSVWASDHNKTDLPQGYEYDVPVPSGKQNVREVRLYIDRHPYDRPAPAWRDMMPSDGEFDSPTEQAELVVGASGLAQNQRHMACIVAVDELGYEGPPSCEYFGVGCTPRDCGPSPEPEPEPERDGEEDCAAIRGRRKCRRMAACRWRRTDARAGRSCVQAADIMDY